MGSSLVGGDIGVNIGAAMNNTDAQVFLPDSDRARPGMQHEEIEDQPMTIQSFMNRPDEDDHDKEGGSQDSLLQWCSE